MGISEIKSTVTQFVSETTDRVSDAMSPVKPTPKFVKKCKKFFKNNTPSDGLDELAVGLISFLPKVVQPPATAVALMLLSPFVRIGGRAMAAEHKETLDNIAHLQERSHDLQKNILLNPNFPDLLQNNPNNETFQAILNYQGDDKDVKTILKCNEYLKDIHDGVANLTEISGFIKDNKKEIKSDDTDEIRQSLEEIYKDVTSKHKTKDVCADIAHFEHNAKELTIENYPNAMRTGTSGMGGMTAGVVSGALKALSETAEQFGVFPRLTKIIPSSGLEKLTTLIFIPSQAAMGVYGLNKAYQGRQKNQHLEEQKQAIKELKTDTDNDIIDAASVHIDALKANNVKGDIVYGIGTAAAETGMIIGGLMGASSILIPSALLTLGFAVMRMRAEKNKKQLTGDTHEHDHSGDILQMMFKPKPSNRTENTPQEQVSTCGTMGCNEQHGDFKDNIQAIKGDFKILEAQLKNVDNKLNYVQSKNFSEEDVNSAKKMICDLLPEEDKKAHVLNMTFAMPTAMPTQLSPSAVYINTLLKNETTTELAVDILIKELEKEKEKDKDKDKDLHKETLEILNADNPVFHNKQTRELAINVIREDLEKDKKGNQNILERLNNVNPDSPQYQRIFERYQDILDKPENVNAKITIENVLSNELQTILTTHLNILDKPENAQKIMPHLLQDRINELKKSRVFSMNNLIHLARKRQLENAPKDNNKGI